MAQIPEDVRREMESFRRPYNLPAMYDHLTWRERREVREEYIVVQGGLCWHCKGDIHLPPDKRLMIEFPLDPRYFGHEFLKHPIHLHHNHITGLTVGATHAYCNAVLAQYYGE